MEEMNKSKNDDVKTKETNFEKLITIHKSEDLELTPFPQSPINNNQEFYLEKPRAPSPMGSVGSEGERPCQQPFFMRGSSGPKFFDEIKDRCLHG